MSDEMVVIHWKRNPYYQFFCGMREYQRELPCYSSESVHFRKHISTDGFEKVFQVCLSLHGELTLEGAQTCGIKRINRLFQLHREAVVGVKLSDNPLDQAHREILQVRQSLCSFASASVLLAMLVGSYAQMTELDLVSTQTGFDIAQALAAS